MSYTKTITHAPPAERVTHTEASSADRRDDQRERIQAAIGRYLARQADDALYRGGVVSGARFESTAKAVRVARGHAIALAKDLRGSRWEGQIRGLLLALEQLRGLVADAEAPAARRRA